MTSFDIDSCRNSADWDWVTSYSGCSATKMHGSNLLRNTYAFLIKHAHHITYELHSSFYDLKVVRFFVFCNFLLRWKIVLLISKIHSFESWVLTQVFQMSLLGWTSMIWWWIETQHQSKFLSSTSLLQTRSIISQNSSVRKGPKPSETCHFLLKPYIKCHSQIFFSNQFETKEESPLCIWSSFL